MLSPDFKPALLRGVTNTDGSVIGISFDLPDRTVVRLALDMDSACGLAEAVAQYIAPYVVRSNSQSSMADGSPNRDGSPHDGQ